MKTRYGKITLITILALAIAFGAFLTLARDAKAGDFAASTVVIPNTGQAAIFAVFRDLDSGNAIHATAGTSSASTTFESGVITATQHAQTDDWLIAVPETNVQILYFALYYSEPADETAVPDSEYMLLDASTGKIFSDVNPTARGRVRIGG